MKYALWLTLFSATLFVSSCKKDEDKPTVDLATVKVRTIQHSNSGLTETYTYDSDGRITQLQLSNGSRTTYAYTADTLNIASFDTTGSLLSTEVMLLSNGLAQSSVVMDASGNILGFHEYSFSGSGEETMHRVLNPNLEQTAKEEWIWSGGNLTTYSIYDSANTNLYNVYYVYNYPGASSTGKVNTGRKYLGADPLYQVRKIFTTGLVGNSIRMLEYTTDDQKRITSALYYDQNHDLKNTDSYTYY